MVVRGARSHPLVLGEFESCLEGWFGEGAIQFHFSSYKDLSVYISLISHIASHHDASTKIDWWCINKFISSLPRSLTRLGTQIRFVRPLRKMQTNEVANKVTFRLRTKRFIIYGLIKNVTQDVLFAKQKSTLNRLEIDTCGLRIGA